MAAESTASVSSSWTGQRKLHHWAALRVAVCLVRHAEKRQGARQSCARGRAGLGQRAGAVTPGLQRCPDLFSCLLPTKAGRGWPQCLIAWSPLQNEWPKVSDPLVSSWELQRPGTSRFKIRTYLGFLITFSGGDMVFVVMWYLP